MPIKIPENLPARKELIEELPSVTSLLAVAEEESDWNPIQLLLLPVVMLSPADTPKILFFAPVVIT